MTRDEEDELLSENEQEVDYHTLVVVTEGGEELTAVELPPWLFRRLVAFPAMLRALQNAREAIVALADRADPKHEKVDAGYYLGRIDRVMDLSVGIGIDPPPE